MWSKPRLILTTRLSNGSLRFPCCAVRVSPQNKPPQILKNSREEWGFRDQGATRPLFPKSCAGGTLRDFASYELFAEHRR